MSTVIFALAVVLGIWYLIVLTFQVIGVTQMFVKHTWSWEIAVLTAPDSATTRRSQSQPSRRH